MTGVIISPIIIYAASVGNNCDAPILAFSDYSSIHIQPEYYYIGHFSKFVPPGSIRIDSNIVGNFNYQTSVHPDVHEGIELGTSSFMYTPLQSFAT